MFQLTEATATNTDANATNFYVSTVWSLGCGLWTLTCHSECVHKSLYSQLTFWEHAFWAQFVRTNVHFRIFSQKLRLEYLQLIVLLQQGFLWQCKQIHTMQKLSPSFSFLYEFVLVDVDRLRLCATSEIEARLKDECWMWWISDECDHVFSSEATDELNSRSISSKLIDSDRW